MDVKQIDAEIAKLQNLRLKAEAEERAKALEANFEEAKKILGDLVPTLNRLQELGYMPPRLLTALSDGTGKWNPGMYIKRPKAPRSTE